MSNWIFFIIILSTHHLCIQSPSFLVVQGTCERIFETKVAFWTSLQYLPGTNISLSIRHHKNTNLLEYVWNSLLVTKNNLCYFPTALSEGQTWVAEQKGKLLLWICPPPPPLQYKHLIYFVVLLPRSENLMEDYFFPHWYLFGSLGESTTYGMNCDYSISAEGE